MAAEALAHDTPGVNPDAPTAVMDLPAPEATPYDPDALHWLDMPLKIEAYDAPVRDAEGNEAIQLGLAFNDVEQLPDWSLNPLTDDSEREIVMHAEDGTLVFVQGDKVSALTRDPGTGEWGMDQIQLEDSADLTRVDNTTGEAWKVTGGDGRTIEVDSPIRAVRVNAGTKQAEDLNRQVAEGVGPDVMSVVPNIDPFSSLHKVVSQIESARLMALAEAKEEPKPEQKGPAIPTSAERIKEWKDDFDARLMDRPEPLPQNPDRPLSIEEQYGAARNHWDKMGKELYDKFDKPGADGLKYWERVDQENKRIADEYYAEKGGLSNALNKLSDKPFRDALEGIQGYFKRSEKADKNEADGQATGNTPADPDAAPDAPKGRFARFKEKASEKAKGAKEWLRLEEAKKKLGKLSLKGEVQNPSDSWEWELENGKVVRYGAVETDADGNKSVSTMIEFTEPGTKFLWESNNPKRRGTVVMETKDDDGNVDGKVVMRGSKVFWWKKDGDQFVSGLYSLDAAKAMPAATIGAEWSIGPDNLNLGKVSRVYEKYRKLSEEEAGEKNVDTDPDKKLINPFGAIDAMVRQIEARAMAEARARAEAEANADDDTTATWLPPQAPRS